MDQAVEPTDRVNEPSPPSTSVEKLEAFFSGASDLSPDTAEQAQLFQMLAMAAPIARRQIPQDPAELDGYLLTIARLAMHLRSDDAEPDALIVTSEEFGADLSQVREALRVAADLAAAASSVAETIDAEAEEMDDIENAVVRGDASPDDVDDEEPAR